MKKYYYKHDGDLCLEECPIYNCFIGSNYCQRCDNYKGGSTTKDYVICKHLQPKRKTNLEKILLRIAAVILWVIIVLGLNILAIKNHDLKSFLSGFAVGLIAYWVCTYIWELSNKLKQ